MRIFVWINCEGFSLRVMLKESVDWTAISASTIQICLQIKRFLEMIIWR